jgi:hypothetical protein
MSGCAEKIHLIDLNHKSIHVLIRKISYSTKLDFIFDRNGQS